MSFESFETPDEPDVEPLNDHEWSQELPDLLSGLARGLNVHRTMANHLALLRAWSDLREHIVNNSALAEDDLEIGILRTSHRLGSHHEWSRHVDRARLRGVSDARISSVPGPFSDMKERDALLCEAFDELFDAANLSKATLADFIAHFGKAAVSDVMATVGSYSTLGYIRNTFRTPLDDDIRDCLAADPLELRQKSTPV